MAHNFQYVGSQYRVPIVALEHSNCSDPKMTPCKHWLFLAISDHFFLVKSAETFVGRFCLPWPTYISGRHHLRPLTPPMGPIFPYLRTFCSKQCRKGEKGEGAHANKTQTVRLHQQPCTPTVETLRTYWNVVRPCICQMSGASSGAIPDQKRVPRKLYTASLRECYAFVDLLRCCLRILVRIGRSTIAILDCNWTCDDDAFDYIPDPNLLPLLRERAGLYEGYKVKDGYRTTVAS